MSNQKKNKYIGISILLSVISIAISIVINSQIAKVYLSGTLNNFVYINYLNNEKQFDTYKTPGDFEKKYNVSETTLNNFKNYAAKDSISFNIDSPAEKSQLEKQIKTLTARQIWRTQGLYEVSNASDVTVQKALQVIKGRDSILESSK